MRAQPLHERWRVHRPVEPLRLQVLQALPRHQLPVQLHRSHLRFVYFSADCLHCSYLFSFNLFVLSAGYEGETGSLAVVDITNPNSYDSGMDISMFIRTRQGGYSALS